MSDTEVGKDVSFTAVGETHHLWIDTAGSGARVMVKIFLENHQLIRKLEDNGIKKVKSLN